VESGNGKTTVALKEQTMKTCKIALLAVTSAFALSLLTTGCDRTVSHSESEKVKSDGSVETQEETVTQSPDGTINKEEKKSTENP
jgi:hypothetical protein